MKFRVTMKDPDTLTDAISDALDNDHEHPPTGLSQDVLNVLWDQRKDRAYSIASKWFKYGEYVTIEIDTEAMTAIVIPVE